MSTSSEPRRPARHPERTPIFASVGQRRRSLSGVAILVLTIAALVAALVVIVANAVV